MKIKHHSSCEKLKKLKAVVIIPTYNNCTTLESVIESVLDFTEDIIVINDGSTDSTEKILDKYKQIVHVISYSKNRGKGYALKTGFDFAKKMSFNYAISIDSDGQHFASDLNSFITILEKEPDSLIVGSRVLKQDNMKKGSSFANRFSNFWFAIQTFTSLPDTQSGYRAYPLRKIGNMKMWTNRYETELEILVFSAWRRIKILPIPISVYYAPPDKRVSHFNPFRDFTRISILNTLLVFMAFIYGYPSMILRYVFRNHKSENV